MCGIVGFLETRSTTDVHALRAMVAAIRHRGPDASGIWTDPDAGIAFGHTRLAIVELSPLGAQPMPSASGRFIMTFNGEVFNFKELSSELQSLGHTFRGTSDTEVMLAAFEQWGIAAALQRFVGMFAFAVWDKKMRELTLARDRLGIKPLYYGHLDKTFVFSSELHALRGHPSWTGTPDRDALHLMLQFGYVPAPWSAIAGIQKLPQGTYLTVGRKGIEGPTPYWTAEDAVARGLANPLEGNESEVIDELDRQLRDAISLRMIADVPLGAFLSGGVDSSLLVALMQRMSSSPIRTFGIGFEDAHFDEAPYARGVAEYLGTHHTELYVSSALARETVPKLARMYDEPFGDSSQIPTYLVAALSRPHVTVSLSGDGGDELFGGYSRYDLLAKLWRRTSFVPSRARRLLASAGAAMPLEVWRGIYQGLIATGCFSHRIKNVGEKIRKVSRALAEPDLESMYFEAMRLWPSSERIVLGSKASFSPRKAPVDAQHNARLQMMFAELVTYLPDDILAKVDRASMAVALEARVPYLDHRLVEFAWRIPLRMKFRGGTGKWILRELLYRYVPRHLVDRPKAGFSVPVDDWIREGVREWAEALLDEKRLGSEGLLDPECIRTCWSEHVTGKYNRGAELWNVLMLQAWYEEIRRPLDGDGAGHLQSEMASAQPGAPA